MLAAGPEPTAPGGPVHQSPHNQDNQNCQVDKQGISAENFAQKRNLIDKRQVHGRQSRLGPQSPPDSEQCPQQEHRQTSGEDVQSRADDEFVALELHHEQRKKSPHQHAHQNGRQHPQSRRPGDHAHRHGHEGSNQDHAVHTDVHDPGVFRQQTAHGRQGHRRSGAEHLPEQTRRKDVTHALPPPFRLCGPSAAPSRRPRRP